MVFSVSIDLLAERIAGLDRRRRIGGRRRRAAAARAAAPAEPASPAQAVQPGRCEAAPAPARKPLSVPARSSEAAVTTHVALQGRSIGLSF